MMKLFRNIVTRVLVLSMALGMIIGNQSAITAYAQANPSNCLGPLTLDFRNGNKPSLSETKVSDPYWNTINALSPERFDYLNSQYMEENIDLDFNGSADVHYNCGPIVIFDAPSTCSIKSRVEFILTDEELARIGSNEDYYSSILFIFGDGPESVDENNNKGDNNGESAPSVQDPAPAHQVGETVVNSGAKFEITSIFDGKQALKYIAPEAKNIKTADIPDNIKIDDVEYKVTEITPGAFKNNKKLRKITIGSNVEKIGKDAFKGCKNLKTIQIKTVLLTKNSVGSGAFKNISPSAKCKVPKTVLKNYKKFLTKKGLNGKGQKITK